MLSLTVLFILWLVFFDSTNYFHRKEMENNLNKLEKEKKFLQKDIAKYKYMYEKLNQKEEIEKFAREEYYMHEPDEEVFIFSE